MKKVILIQARLSSSRYPKKMLEQINGYTLTEYVYNRCLESKLSDEVAVITSNQKSDDELYKLCVDKNIPVYRGELENVLKRYVDASDFFKADVICRVCGDSPFVDIEAVDKMFDELTKVGYEYMSTINSLNGFMSEVFSLNLLNKVYNSNLSQDDKEHVTKYIRDNIKMFNTKNIDLDARPKDLEKFTLTVDYPEDINVTQKIASNLNSFDFHSKDIIKILKQMEDNNELYNT